MNIFIQIDLKIKKKEGVLLQSITIVKECVSLMALQLLTAEAKAIDLGLEFVNTCTYTDTFVIFSDSFLVLQALTHSSAKNSQIQHSLLKHHGFSSFKTVIYCWIPRHLWQ